MPAEAQSRNPDRDRSPPQTPTETNLREEPCRGMPRGLLPGEAERADGEGCLLRSLGRMRRARCVVAPVPVSDATEGCHIL